MHHVRESYSCQATVELYAKAFLSISPSAAECALARKYLPQSGHMLDVGCSTGRGVRLLLSLGCRHATGVDISEPMIRKAREHFRDEPGCSFRVMDVTADSLPPAAYDGALALHGIMPIPTFARRVAALRNVNSALRAGSHLVMASFLRPSHDPSLTDYTDGDSLHQLQAAGSRPVFIHIPDKDEIAQAFHLSGFTLVDMVPFSAFAEQAEIHSSQKCMYSIGRKDGNG